MQRSTKERLIFSLNQIRKELLETVSPIPSSELNFAPKEGMKSYRDLLVETGAMEAESVRILNTGIVPKWEDMEALVTGNTTEEILSSLMQIRTDLLEFLEKSDDEELLTTVTIPDTWINFFGGKEVEKEEFVRWICRHEYYHLGQIITYRWIQGFNPYEKQNC